MIRTPQLNAFMKIHGDYFKIESDNALYFADGARVTGVSHSLRNQFYEANPNEYGYHDPPEDASECLANRRLYCDSKLEQELKLFDAYQQHLHIAIHNHATYPDTCGLPNEDDYSRLDAGRQRVEKLQLLHAELEHEYQQERVGREGETRIELQAKEAQRQQERSAEVNAAQQRLAKCMPAGVTEQDLEAIRARANAPKPAPVLESTEKRNEWTFPTGKGKRRTA